MGRLKNLEEVNLNQDVYSREYELIAYVEIRETMTKKIFFIGPQKYFCCFFVITLDKYREKALLRKTSDLFSYDIFSKISNFQIYI